MYTCANLTGNWKNVLSIVQSTSIKFGFVLKRFFIQNTITDLSIFLFFTIIQYQHSPCVGNEIHPEEKGGREPKKTRRHTSV